MRGFFLSQALPLTDHSDVTNILVLFAVVLIFSKYPPDIYFIFHKHTMEGAIPARCGVVRFENLFTPTVEDHEGVVSDGDFE